MYVKHLGADMLLHRARQVLGQLETAEHDYLASGAVTLEPSVGPEGTTLLRCRVAEPPHPELSVMAREAFRACRGALDDLAVSLVVASRRAPRATVFPIAVDAHAYSQEESRCLRHANQEARRAVRSVTPWRGADDALWDLRQLVEAGEPVVGLGQVVEVAPTRVPSPLGVLQPGAQASRACVLLGEGRLLVAGREPWASTPVLPVGAGLQLVATYGDPVRHRPLVPLLVQQIAHVADVIERVVAAAEHRPSR